MAAKIIGIYNTNSLEAGVCRLLSRVNHSCLPSAEMATNPDLESQDLRAIRQINLGEEITANYADLEDGLNQAELHILTRENGFSGFSDLLRCFLDIFGFLLFYFWVLFREEF